MRLIYFDVETTGVSIEKDDIWEFSGVIEEDGKVLDGITIKMRPRNPDRLDSRVLSLFNKTKDELMSYQDRDEAVDKLITWLKKWTNFNDRVNLVPCGYNVTFDIQFFNKLFNSEFKQKGVNPGLILDHYKIDVMSLSMFAIMTSSLGSNITSFKLGEICSLFGIEFESNKAHGSLYDVKKTRELLKFIMSKMSITI